MSNLDGETTPPYAPVLASDGLPPRLALLRRWRWRQLWRRFSAHTMLKPEAFKANLELLSHFADVPGCVVECGVWRGGMSGAMATLLGPRRRYFLYDSFEGLPPAQAIDGLAAQAWQADRRGASYHDNCRAEQASAEEAMRSAGATDCRFVKGWFQETVPHFDRAQKIAVLRLDGDWYASTMVCMEHLFDLVVPGGVVIFDDYYAWDGCSRAVHDFMSRRQLSERIQQWGEHVAFVVKRPLATEV